MGRKGKYYEVVYPKLEVIKGWMREGAIEKEVFTRLGISSAAFSNYKNQHEELRAALREGKEHADFAVENALYKSAMGYDYDEVSVTEDSEFRTTTKTTNKKVLPNVTAQIFWVKNRMPEKWQDKKQVDGSIRTVIVDDIE